ncbi:PQQ-binding-like beta-propeller repeat protein [Streptomyces sp. NPDC051956]|uniref:serine/threonine-protein kinase n=1 Tax=Streptomyces sp. NPDC051956 TaxID=3365677 RepID=UPI0037D48020
MTEILGERRPGDPVVLGPWRLLGVLGEGGMGTVHLGIAGRRVAAVKTLRPELLAEAHFLDRFRRERQAVDAARHPYVPRLLGADLDGPQPWMATEFVAGPTLERCVESYGPLPEGSVRTLGGLLASALIVLHDAGVVHRDLKPSNVLLATDGPRLVDFGIARLPAATVITVTGQRPGSSGYMSPEQVLGRELGPPSDVFTLGALLAYASTGHHAFGGEGHAAVDYAVAYDDPDLSLVPPPLRDDLRRCLERSPGRRPTARELAAVWSPQTKSRRARRDWLPSHVVAGISEMGRTTSELTGERRMTRRRVVGASAATVLVGGGVGGWLMYGRNGGGRKGGAVPLWDGAPGQVPEPVWSVSGLDPDVPFGPASAGGVLLVANPGRVSALDPRTGGRLWSYAGGRAPAPRAPRPVLVGPDGVLRGFDARTGEVTWRGPGGLDRLLAADTDTAYGTDAAGHVVAVRFGADALLWSSTVVLDGSGEAVAVAAAGHLLVTTRDGSTRALNSSTGKRSWTVKAGSGEVRCAAVGDGFAVLGGATLRGLDLASGTERWRARPVTAPGEFGTPVIHEGRVYVTDDYRVRCLRLTDGSGVREVVGTGGRYAVAQPVAAAHGLYIPLTTGTDGVAAVPLAGDAERYRFSPQADQDSAWAVTTAGGVVAMQNGGHLYALPRF